MSRSPLQRFQRYAGTLKSHSFQLTYSLFSHLDAKQKLSGHTPLGHILCTSSRVLMCTHCRPMHCHCFRLATFQHKFLAPSRLLGISPELQR